MNPLAHPHLKMLYIRWNTWSNWFACTSLFVRLFPRSRWHNASDHFVRSRFQIWLDDGWQRKGQRGREI